MLLALGLDELHTERHLSPLRLPDVLLHGQADQNILVVHFYRILGILIGQKDTNLGESNLAPLETLVSDGVSIDVHYSRLVVGMTHKDPHFVGGVVRQQHNSVLVLRAVFGMEQLFAEVVECLDYDFARDDEVGNLTWVRLVLSPRVVTLQAHQSEQLAGVGRDQENDGVNDDENDEGPALPCDRREVTVADSRHGCHHKVEGGMEEIWVIRVVLKVLDDHEKN